MATTAAPYGLKPVGLIGSRPYPHGMRLMRIADSYPTAIFQHDVLKCVNDGTVAKDTGTDTLTPVGIFMGCQYTDSSGFRQNCQWPASTNSTDDAPWAFVVDDPDVVFEAQADDTLALTAVFTNVGVIQTAGSTAVGISKVALDASDSATTDTLPIRIIDMVDGPFSAVGDAYTDCICIWNWGMHAYRTATGV